MPLPSTKSIPKLKRSSPVASSASCTTSLNAAVPWAGCRCRAHNHFWQNSRLTEITLRLILWFNGWPPEQLIDAVVV